VVGQKHCRERKCRNFKGQRKRRLFGAERQPDIPPELASHLAILLTHHLLFCLSQLLRRGLRDRSLERVLDTMRAPRSRRREGHQMSQQAYNPLPVETWQAQNLRVIVFTAENQVPSGRQWWRDLTGIEPDSTVKRKTEREEAGLYEGVQLAVSIDPLRIQWVAAASLDPAAIGEGAPLLGGFPEKRDWFLQHMRHWLETCPPVKRVAFLATLLQRVASHEEGYTRLNQYLRHVEVFPDSSDFLYRVNRRRPYRITNGELKNNILSTWSVVRLTTEVAPIGTSERRAAAEEVSYLAVELDVNTSHEYPNPLPTGELPGILSELGGLATEVATRGDVRGPV
jgi:hypothetical protein